MNISGALAPVHHQPTHVKRFDQPGGQSQQHAADQSSSTTTLRSLQKFSYQDYQQQSERYFEQFEQQIFGQRAVSAYTETEAYNQRAHISEMFGVNLYV